MLQKDTTILISHHM